MFYHVLIETNEKVGKSKTNKQIFEIDRTDKELLLSDIIIPFVKKEEFQFNGYFINTKDVVRLMVKTTEKSARELSQYENDNMPAGIFMYVSPQDIFSYDKYTKDITKEILDEAKKIKPVEITPVVNRNIHTTDKTKVFIVHGHDKGAKEEMARFIEKLGITAIILHEQANEGSTIIEKIEKNSNVGFAVILYTACDFGGKDTSNLRPRARQNVVFEHGYFIAKLGRNNVCALVAPNVEKPGDIDGVVYLPFDTNGGWKLSLAKELKSAGYDIDFNLVI